MNNKDERAVASAQIDKYLPLPFERTAVTGFGFVQIIRRRERMNLMELLRADPVETAAPALLRRAERHGNGGRSAQHTSELQSLMRRSYAVFCLKKKTMKIPNR